MRFQNSWENDAMENDIILCNKMYQLAVVIFPVFFPIKSCLLSKLFCSGNVSDGRIEPNIKYLSICIWQWHFYAPIKVAGHRSRLQPLVDPRFTLSINIWFPFFVAI